MGGFATETSEGGMTAGHGERCEGAGEGLFGERGLYRSSGAPADNGGSIGGDGLWLYGHGIKLRSPESWRRFISATPSPQLQQLLLHLLPSRIEVEITSNPFRSA